MDSPQCKLFDLPPELRNEIYTYVLQQPEPISIFWLGEGPMLHDTKTNYCCPKKRRLMALTCTNRQIRNESLKLFYSCNEFLLQSNILSIISLRGDEADINWGHLDWIWDWLADVGSAQVSVLQNVTISLGDRSTKPNSKEHLYLHIIPDILKHFAIFFHDNKTECSVIINAFNVNHKVLCERCWEAEHLPLKMSVSDTIEGTLQSARFLLKQDELRQQLQSTGHAYHSRALYMQIRSAVIMKQALAIRKAVDLEQEENLQLEGQKSKNSGTSLREASLVQMDGDSSSEAEREASVEL